MLACDGENTRTNTKCVGFYYTTSSNTCSFTTTMDGLMSNTSSTNSVYFVSGLETGVRQFYKNAGKSMPTSNVGYSVSVSTLNDCASNCVSNVTCNGFTFAGTSCSLYNDMDESKFITQANTDSYPLKEHQAFTSLSDFQYWT
jgi:hypothetical protein